MASEQPTDLTEVQWLLLRYLHRFSIPFYTEVLYAQFLEHGIERLQFYYLFFGLAVLGYIKMVGTGEDIPGQKLDFCYIVTPKGKQTIAQAIKRKNTNQKFSNKHLKQLGSTCFAGTIRLKDYSFIH